MPSYAFELCWVDSRDELAEVGVDDEIAVVCRVIHAVELHNTGNAMRHNETPSQRDTVKSLLSYTYQ